MIALTILWNEVTRPLRAARSILEAPDSTPSQRSVARAELGIWGEETKSRTVTAHRLGDCS